MIRRRLWFPPEPGQEPPTPPSEPAAPRPKRFATKAEADEAARKLAEVDRRDWHRPLPGEPPCGPHEWRQRDRYTVIRIKDMTDSHLAHAIRFSNKAVHQSRRQALLNEYTRRMTVSGSTSWTNAARHTAGQRGLIRPAEDEEPPW